MADGKQMESFVKSMRNITRKLWAGYSNLLVLVGVPRFCHALRPPSRCDNRFTAHHFKAWTGNDTNIILVIGWFPIPKNPVCSCKNKIVTFIVSTSRLTHQVKVPLPKSFKLK